MPYHWRTRPRERPHRPLRTHKYHGRSCDHSRANANAVADATAYRTPAGARTSTNAGIRSSASATCTRAYAGVSAGTDTDAGTTCRTTAVASSSTGGPDCASATKHPASALPCALPWRRRQCRGRGGRWRPCGERARPEPTCKARAPRHGGAAACTRATRPLSRTPRRIRESGHPERVAGAHVACPFTVNGIEVHCPGILGARRASDTHWKVAFYDGDAWFVRRDRLFTVVDLAAA